MAADNHAYLSMCANREYLAAQAATCLSATLAHLALAELYMDRLSQLTEIGNVYLDGLELKRSVARSSAPIAAKSFVRVHKRIGAAEETKLKLPL